MRAAAVTLLVGAGIAAVALAAGWTVQAAVLPHPERGDEAAIRALTLLGRHRLVESRMRIDGGPVVRARCLEGWFPRRGTLLELNDGARIVDLRTTEVSPRAGLELALAACPRVLVPRLEQLIQSGARTQLARAWAGRPALRVRIDARRVRYTLMLVPKTDALLQVAVRGPHLSGASRVRVVRLTPALVDLIAERR